MHKGDTTRAMAPLSLFAYLSPRVVRTSAAVRALCADVRAGSGFSPDWCGFSPDWSARSRLHATKRAVLMYVRTKGADIRCRTGYPHGAESEPDLRTVADIRTPWCPHRADLRARGGPKALHFTPPRVTYSVPSSTHPESTPQVLLSDKLEISFQTYEVYLNKFLIFTSFILLIFITLAVIYISFVSWKDKKRLKK